MKSWSKLLNKLPQVVYWGFKAPNLMTASPAVIYHSTKVIRFAAATLWNSFPSDVHLSPSLPSFKKNLKTFLFKDAFELYLWTCIVILLCIYFFPLWLLYLQSALSVIKLTDTGAIQVYIIIIIIYKLRKILYYFPKRFLMKQRKTYKFQHGRWWWHGRHDAAGIT